MNSSVIKFIEAIRTCESPSFIYSHDYDLITIPDEIKALKAQLQSLHIDNCFNIRKVTPGIGDLPLLRWLNLSYNNLSEIPGTIGKLKHLERLHLNNNVITKLPLEIWGLKDLEELRVDNNKLRALPSPILFMEKLRELFTENNPFVTEADVEGAEMMSLFPPPRYGDCSNCCGHFGPGAISFVTFHDICGNHNVPFCHYVCDEVCEKHLRDRLSELPS
eukprot:Tbor_TRINITY_DN6163_c0_g4::TRINITY_DN6163_c0_g4_i1::g.22227::m.22227